MKDNAVALLPVGLFITAIGTVLTATGGVAWYSIGLNVLGLVILLFAVVSLMQQKNE